MQDIRHTRSYAVNPAFYEHPVIQALADTQRWTISHEKKPLNADAIANGCLNRGEIKGAYMPAPPCLNTLDFLILLAPETPLINHTFYLDALRDRYVILDIEPKCPDELKAQLLQLPYLYGEYSMSGKGFHLVFDTPLDILNQYPNAMSKKVLKEEHGYYEFLMDHYCTFTRRMIVPAQTQDKAKLYELFTELCKQQKPPVTMPTVAVEEPKDIPNYGKIMRLMNSVKPPRPLSDFSDDESKFEASTACAMYNKLMHVIAKLNSSPQFVKHDYTRDERAWLLYYILQKCLPYRAKHETERDGLPWLLYIANSAISYIESSENKIGSITLPESYNRQIAHE